jgi:hypothetical protein
MYSTINNSEIRPATLGGLSGYVNNKSFAGLGIARETAAKGDMTTCDIVFPGGG